MTERQQDVFQAISDPGRRQMLQLLATGSMTINAMASNFDMSRPAVSKHLKLLELAGFICIVDKGRERCCTLKEEGFNQLRQWMTFYDQFWAGRLRKLGDLLETN